MYISDPELFADYLMKTERVGRERTKSKNILTDLQQQIALAKFNQMDSVQKSYDEPIPNNVKEFLEAAGIEVESNITADRDLVNVTCTYIFRF